MFLSYAQCRQRLVDFAAAATVIDCRATIPVVVPVVRMVVAEAVVAMMLSDLDLFGGYYY